MTAEPTPARYPPGGCVLVDKTRCTLPPATCCDLGLAIRWPGEPQPAAVARALAHPARLAAETEAS